MDTSEKFAQMCAHSCAHMCKFHHLAKVAFPQCNHHQKFIIYKISIIKNLWRRKFSSSMKIFFFIIKNLWWNIFSSSMKKFFIIIKKLLMKYFFHLRWKKFFINIKNLSIRCLEKFLRRRNFFVNIVVKQHHDFDMSKKHMCAHCAHMCVTVPSKHVYIGGYPP